MSYNTMDMMDESYGAEIAKLTKEIEFLTTQLNGSPLARRRETMRVLRYARQMEADKNHLPARVVGLTAALEKIAHWGVNGNPPQDWKIIARIALEKDKIYY